MTTLTIHTTSGLFEDEGGEFGDLWLLTDAKRQMMCKML